ncbi:hypothetical protein V3C99_014499, partial [Haemonchus contortus]
MLILLV